MSILGDFVDKVGTVFSSISAVVAMVFSYLNYKKIAEVHVQINSRMDQLLIVTGLKSKAEGRAEGKEEQQKKEWRD